MLLRIFTEPQQGATYDQLVTVAQHAEAAGFDAFFRSDHYLVMGDGDGLPGPTDAWITLAGIARETSRIRLGTLVTAATFRLPGPLAISVAEVDAMSGGRVELGLGAGWFDAEHSAYGIPFPPLGERFERLEEQLAVITGLWATPAGERFDFAGKHYQVADSPALPSRSNARVHRSSSEGVAPSGRPGWPPASPPSSTSPSPRWRTPPPSSKGCARRARQQAATPARWSTRLPRWCAAAGTTPTSPGGRRPSGARWTSSVATGCAALPTRWWPRSPRMRKLAPPGSTCRCSTSTTSTT